jgi:4-amino-4-deoxy-L-arabinose transferase-like glycosyltransferase
MAMPSTGYVQELEGDSAPESRLDRLARALTSPQAAALALALAVAVALLAPLGPLAANRFHRDEAIYSSWGLDIASGRDLLVSGSPVDKPPLFLYVQALSFVLFGPTEVAARLPSLVASLASVGLVYALGRSLYGQGAGLLAAGLLAASPYAILFAPTAFTDPLMVAWVLAGCLAAARGRWAWAGIGLGLAAMTKQQGIFFVPLAIGLGQISNVNRQTSTIKSQILSFGIAWLAMLGLALGWDVARARQPGFWMQSLTSYGGLPLDSAAIWQRVVGFWDLLGYGTGSPVLNGILLAGLPVLLVVDVLSLSGREKGRSAARADVILLAFGLAFLAGHCVVAFQVWDRYLLGMIPLLALLLARVLLLPWRLVTANDGPASPGNLMAKRWSPERLRLLYLLFVMSILSFTLRPIQDAAASRFPIGGDHGAYQGIEQVVAYLRTVPANTTLYHRWLGWHWRFYLWGSPYDFRAWTSPADLAAQAAARPGARRYIVFPSWASSSEARLALSGAGLALREVQRAFREDGSVSFVVYRIEEVP